MNTKAALALFVVAAIGGAILFGSILDAGREYAAAQDARIKEMQAYGSGSR